jgi:hypothetical protein
MANALNKDFIVKNGLVVQAVGSSQSTSTTTGAIVTPGGIGIGGNANIAGGLVVGGVNLLGYDDHVYYVSDGTSASDSNDGRRIQSAFRTLKYALSIANAGDSIFIAAGDYEEIFPLTIPQGVSVRGEGLRSTIVRPTVGTKSNDAFLMNGETTISDLCLTGHIKPGWAFKFAPGAKITTKSPYIQRFSVITIGSSTTTADPYGFAAGDAGNGVYLDASVLDPTSLEPSMLMNEATFIVPNATGIYMTNGARSEVINGFFYFANKAIEAVAGTTGFGGAGKTKIRVGGVTGTFTAGDTLKYYSSTGTLLVSSTISSVDGNYIYFNSPVYGFQTNADLSTSTQVVFSTGASAATATSILLADYHQFGAEIRSIGSAAVFGNYGVIANGTGTDIKLIAFNVSHIGAGGDLSDDISKVVQANEIVQQNNGKVYFQTVDQSGDFRVGSQFLINQRTGNVNFGTATINLASLPALDVTDGVYHTYVTPTSITVGDLTFSGGTVASATENITINAGGGNITLADSTYVQGTLTATNVIKSLSSANAVSTNTGAVQSQGGIGVAKDIFVGGNINVVGVTTTSNLVATTGFVTALTATSVTATNLNVTVQQTVASSLITTLTATNFTSPNATISNLTLTTGSVATLIVSSNSNTNSTITGALVVTGGVGVGRDLYIGGDTYLQGNLYVDGDSFVVSSTNLLIADKTISLASTASSAILAIDSGLIVGTGTGYASILYDGSGSWKIKGSVLPNGTMNFGALASPWNNIYGSSLFDSSNRVVTAVNPSAGSGIGITGLASGGPSVSFVVTNTGVISLIAGTDTAVSSASGNVTISGTSTLQSVTSRGGSSNQNIQLTSSTPASSQTTGTLVVTGGVGIGGALYAGNMYSNGAAVWTTASLSNNNQLINGSNYLTSSTLGLYGVSALNAGVGISVSGSTGSVTVTNIGVVSLQGSSYIGISASSGSNITLYNLGVQQITTGSGISITTSTGTVNIASVDTLQLVTGRGNSTNQTINITANNQGASTSTGQALTVAGGIGALSVFATNLFDSGNRALTSVTPVGGNAIGVSAVSTSGPNTTFTINNQGVTSAVGTTYLGVSASTGSVTFTNLGVQTLTAGTDTAVSASTGTITVWTTATLQSVTSRGSSTNQILTLSNLANATSTNTGALQVAGGVGITRDLYIGGDVTILGTVNASTVVGSISTATNLFGGALGGIPYQAATGTTRFISIGTVGQILQVGASNTATWVNTTSIYVGNSKYAITATDVSGGTVSAGVGTFTGVVTITNNAASAATNSGALIVAGGVGVGGSVVAGQLYDSSNRVVTSVTPGAGNSGIGISNLTANGPAVSFTITNLGVVAAVGTTYLGVSSSTGTVTFSNLGVQTLTAGTDTAVSNSTGTVTVWTTSTLQSVTGRGATTNQAISITNTASSNTSTAGALTVSGGVGIGQNLNVGGTLNVQGATTFSSPVTFSGTATYVFSTNTVYTDNLIELHAQSTGTLYDWTADDGKDIGLRFHYFNRSLATGTSAALVLANDTQWLEWYASGAESGNIFTSSNYGSFRLGAIQLTNLTNATSTATGSLVIAGGVGIGRDLYAGGLIYSNGSQVVTAATLGSFGVSQIIAGPYISVSPTAGTGTVTIGNMGVQYIATGSGISVSTSTGTVIIASADTLQLVTGRGATTNQAISITSSTISTSTNSGALTVAGGVGIGGNLYVQQSATFFSNITGIITTATNVAGGLAGALHYQQSVGQTSFISIGATGTILQSNGVSPAYITTQSLQVGYAIYAVTATNIANGSAGQIPYQNAIGQTSFTGGSGSAGNILVSNGGSAPSFVNTLTLAGTTQASSTNSGALQVVGGVGVGGNLYAGGNIFASGSAVVTAATLGQYGVAQILPGQNISVSPSSGTGTVTIGNLGVTATIGTTYLGVSATTGSVVFTNLGVQTAVGTTYLGVSNSTGSVTFTNLGVQTITAGTDTVVSSSTGTVTIWGNATLQSVTSRGATTNQAISITNTTSATSTVSGALQVSGGVGIGKDLWVGGSAYLSGDLYVDGTQFIVSSSNIATGDKTITLSTASASAALAANSGLQVGPTGSLYITWLYDGVGNWVSNGGIKSTNTLTVVSSVNASSTTTGALIVGGGAGFGGNIYANGNIFAAGSQVLTAATLGSFGVSNILAGPYISVSPTAGTGTVTIGNMGVQQITAGSGTSISTSTGTVNIASIDTLQLVTDRGWTTTNRINISNTLAGLTTNTNQALLVAGGIGALIVSASAMYDNSNRVLTSVQPSAGGGIAVTSLTTSSGAVSFTVTNTGVLSVIGTTYLGVSSTTSNVTLTNLGVQTLTAGTDTAVSASTGTITVWSTATLQSITNRANSTTNAIYITNNTVGTSTTTGALTVGGTIGALGLSIGGTTSTFASNVIITTSTAASSTTTGALVVTGGVGVGGNLYAGGNIFAAGSQVITAVTLGNFGVSQIVAGQYISVSPAAGTGTVTIGNMGVQQITTGSGISVTTSTGTVNIASIDTLQLVTGRGATTNQAISITSSTVSTSTNSGALQIAGGVGIGGSVYVGNRVGFGTANTSTVYQFYNAATNSLDTVFG